MLFSLLFPIQLKSLQHRTCRPIHYRRQQQHVASFQLPGRFASIIQFQRCQFCGEAEEWSGKEPTRAFSTDRSERARKRHGRTHCRRDSVGFRRSRRAFGPRFVNTASEIAPQLALCERLANRRPVRWSRKSIGSLQTRPKLAEQSPNRATTESREKSAACAAKNSGNQSGECVFVSI